MTKKQKRLAELKALDRTVLESLMRCSKNISALHRLMLQEEKNIQSLEATRKLYEVELLELQSESDYVKDVNAQEGSNLVF